MVILEKHFLSNTKDVVFTLPAIAVGNVYTFVNTGADGQNNLTISPDGLQSDGILYLGGSSRQQRSYLILKLHQK